MLRIETEEAKQLRMAKERSLHRDGVVFSIIVVVVFLVVFGGLAYVASHFLLKHW